MAFARAVRRPPAQANRRPQAQASRPRQAAATAPDTEVNLEEEDPPTPWRRSRAKAQLQEDILSGRAFNFSGV